MKLLKVGIATGPVAGSMVASYQSAGGGTAGAQNALNALSTAYTGYNPSTGVFTPGSMAVGYIPLFGAWLFGKVASRVLRM